MKTIMILGASILQLPAIIKAKELGYRTIVLDYNPKAVGNAYADKNYLISTNDINGVVQAALSLRPDGIFTLATDMPMKSIAAAAEALRLPGISNQTALLTTDKGEMIKLFKKKDIPHPWFYIIKKESDLKNIKYRVGYPCIVKPTDNSGSRGVIMIAESEMLEKAYFYSKQYSPSGTVIFEEYMVGSEVSAELIVSNGVPHVLAITDKLTTGAPYFVELGHSQSSQLGSRVCESIIQLAKEVAIAVGIKDGAAHIEMIITDSGPKMVEIGARLGGDCIATHLVPLSTGIDIVEAAIQLAMGIVPNLQPQFDRGSAIRYLNVPQGKIQCIDGIEKARKSPGVQEVVLMKNQGDIVGQIRSSVDRVGYVIADGQNASVAIENCNNAVNQICIQINSNC